MGIADATCVVGISISLKSSQVGDSLVVLCSENVNRCIYITADALYDIFSEMS